MKSLLKKISTLITTAALVFVPQTALLATATHAQDINQSVCEGALLDENANCTTEDEQNSFNDLMIRIINIFSIVVGSVSVIMIIVGGFRYIISNGDSNGVTGAKNTILYAIVGLVIVLFAQIIVRFVLTNVSPD